jgi:uncharacterized membrane protein (DUF106 family)
MAEQEFLQDKLKQLETEWELPWDTLEKVNIGENGPSIKANYKARNMLEEKLALELRKKEGDVYADYEQKKADEAQERMTRLKDREDLLQEERNRSRDELSKYVQSRPDIFTTKRRIFLLTASLIIGFIAELYLFHILLSDWLRESALIAALSGLTFLGVFGLAHKALTSKNIYSKIAAVVGYIASVSVLTLSRVNLFARLSGKEDFSWEEFFFLLFVTGGGPMVVVWIWGLRSRLVDELRPFRDKENQFKKADKTKLNEIRRIKKEGKKAEKEYESSVEKYRKYHKEGQKKMEVFEYQSRSFIRSLLASILTYRWAHRFWSKKKGQAKPSVKRKDKKGIYTKRFVPPFFSIMFIMNLGCGRVEEPFNMVILLDWSSSSIHDPEMVLNAGKMWVDEALSRGSGGVFEVLQVGHGIDDAKIAFRDVCPTEEELIPPLSASRNDFMKTFQDSLIRAIERLPKHSGSAILEAIKIASIHIWGFRGETLFLMLSDLRLVNHRFNMEKSVPPLSVLDMWARNHGLVTTLPEQCMVMVAGFHPYTLSSDTTPISPKNYSDLKDLWLSVFKLWWEKEVPINEMVDINDWSSEKEAGDDLLAKLSSWWK